MNSKNAILVICEGDSEFAYVQELNRYLNEKGSDQVLVACNAGGGGFRSIRQVCRNKKTKRNGRTYVFADRDIYFRNDNGNGDMPFVLTDAHLECLEGNNAGGADFPHSEFSDLVKKLRLAAASA